MTHTANPMRRALLAGVALLATAGAPRAATAQSSQAEQLYERVARHYSTLRTIDTQFEQKITNPLLGRTVTSHGRFVQQQPNLVAITFTDPVGDRIVGDGTSLWVYLPSSTPGQVLKLPANAEGAVIVNLLGQLLDVPKQSFVISGGDSATLNGTSTRRLQLVPRVANSAPFQRATLWVDEKELRPLRVQVLDAQGVDRTITMLSWATNTSVDKDTFRFTPPKGVKVISSMP